MFVCRRHQIKFQVYVRVHVNISFVSIILINLIELFFFLDNGLCNILQTFGPAYELFPKWKILSFSSNIWNSSFYNWNFAKEPSK